MPTSMEEKIKDYVRVLIYMVQATGTLVAAVVMAAGFTGDYRSPPPPTAAAAAFYAFAVTDALAFACSLSAIFAYFFLAALGSPSPPFYLDAGGFDKNSVWTHRFARSMLVLALFALAIAFAAGLYSLLLAHSVAVSVAVAVLALLFFPLVFLALCLFTCM